MRHASLTSLSLIGAVASVAVAGSASAGTVNFATAAPAGSTYSTLGTSAGNSSAWNSTGWDGVTAAWQLTAAPAVTNSYAVFSIDPASSSAMPSTTLGNAYASGTARYAANSNVPASGENISPVFVFRVSIDNVNDTEITIGGVGGIYALGSSNAYDAVRARQAFGFQLGANAGGAIVQVISGRSGLAAGFADGTGTTTWDQLMAATTAGGATYGSLALTSMSVVAVYADGFQDPATQFNSTSVLVQQFSIVPAPGALALLGVAGLAGGRRRRA